jgi:hypothetical protein
LAGLQGEENLLIGGEYIMDNFVPCFCAGAVEYVKYTPAPYSSQNAIFPHVVFTNGFFTEYIMDNLVPCSCAGAVGYVKYTPAPYSLQNATLPHAVFT